MRPRRLGALQAGRSPSLTGRTWHLPAAICVSKEEAEFFVCPGWLIQLEAYPTVSQRKLHYASQGAQFEAVIIRLAVDEKEIRPDVAVAVVAPFAGQWVIEIPARQRRVGGEQVDDLHQQGVQLLAWRPDFSRL